MNAVISFGWALVAFVVGCILLYLGCHGLYLRESMSDGGLVPSMCLMLGFAGISMTVIFMAQSVVDAEDNYEAHCALMKAVNERREMQM